LVVADVVLVVSAPVVVDPEVVVEVVVDDVAAVGRQALRMTARARVRIFMMQ
jgi:hypothetical protein